MIDVDRRADLIARGAAEWRDPDSPVRAEARDALRGGAWSPPVVEAALDNALWDLDGENAARLTHDRKRADPRPVLVVLPGNIIGPAVACAYCAAAAGASIIMKSPGAEQALAKVVAQQFDQLGPPLAGTIDARYWTGGDAAVEAPLLASVRHAVVFGGDDTIEELRRRSPGTHCIAYGDSYSVGLVLADADLKAAASNAARDVCIFDQRGCMSPQTIYVEGDDGRALRFAHALAAAIRAAIEILPRSPIGRDEAEAVAMAIRRLAVSAVAPMTHGLDTLIVGPDRGGAPEFVIAVEPAGPPTRHGYARIVAVKACADVHRFAEAVADDGGARKETLGYAGTLDQNARETLARRSLLRICALGEMQRPPFGYRPRVEDFA